METPIYNDLNAANGREVSIKNNYPEFHKYLLENYPEELSFSERIYWYYNKLVDYPRCVECGKIVCFINFRKGYRTYCSTKCMNNADVIRKRKRQTLLDHFGVDEPFKSPEVQDKVRKTNLERYGVEHVFSSEEIKEKIRKTNLERYGVENVNQAKEIRDKFRKTNLERYGVENPSQVEEFKEKRRQTNLERYGVENVSLLKSIRKKVKETNLERYGVECSSKNEIVKNKSKQTKLERYGDPTFTNRDKYRETISQRYGGHPMQTQEIKNKLQNRLRENILENHPDVIDYTDDGQWIHKCPHPDCNKCQEKNFIIKPRNLYGRIVCRCELCTKLLPMQPTFSSLELWVRNILDECNIEYNENDRSVLGGKELDIYIPSKKIAIECNGIYWHSSTYKSRSYHRDKFKSCLDAGVQLLTVWEDQIVNHPDIVKSVILSKLGIYNERLGARQCIVKEISNSEANKFLDMNHIQGRTQQKLSLGMYYKDRLVGVMTFNHRSKLSGSKQVDLTEWELTRFCTLLNMQIVGAADKLFKYFINKYSPRKVTSFSSNDISTGGLYKKLGFESDMSISGAYWYIEDTTMKRYHRSTFSKGALKKRGIDITDRTESEIMSGLPYHRIDDSGHMRWEWTEQ